MPPKITAHGLQTQPIDATRGQLIEDHRRRAEDEKHFVKANMKGLRQQQMEYKLNELTSKAAADKKRNFQTKYNTKIPTYLRKFRREEEEERLRTLEEIAMNKRPAGTRCVTATEKSQMLDELAGRKAYCEEGIQNMSVTLYTNRA